MLDPWGAITPDRIEEILTRIFNGALMRPGGTEQKSPNNDRGMETALLGSRYLASSRLDVTV